MKMKKHGTVDFYWLDNLLVIKTYGPFNEEGVDHAISEVKESVQNQEAKAWLRLEILDDETLGSPTVLARVKELHQWCEYNGCDNSAIVVSNNLQVYMVENMIESQINVFRDLDKAKTWLGVSKC